MPRTAEQLEQIKSGTKKKILDSALELFATKSFHGTSMQDIADHAGISKGLAYNYFESKDTILNAILDTALKADDQIMNAAEKTKDPYEQLVLLINRTFDHLEKNENYWRMFSILMLQPQLADVTTKLVNEFGTNIIDETVKIFKRIGIKNPLAEALVLDGAIDGIILHYLFLRDKYPLKKVRKLLLEKYSKESLRNKRSKA